MPKQSLISGAKEFLQVVFAHRIRERELFVASFRRPPSSELPDRATQDGVRFLSEARDYAISDWSEM
jgi:hypothetical protein